MEKINVYVHMLPDGVNPKTNSKNFIEIAPGCRADFDDDGKLFGVEITGAVRVQTENVGL